jgi:putative flippase GtrA
LSRPAPGAGRSSLGTTRRALRFGTVGLLSLGVDFGVYVMLYRLTRVGVEVAAAGGYCAAFAVNFGLNRSWVFGAAGSRGSAHVRRYLVLVGVNFVLTVLAVSLLVDHGVEYRLAKLAVAVVIAACNFVAMGRWVFAAPPAQDARLL